MANFRLWPFSFEVKSYLQAASSLFSLSSLLGRFLAWTLRILLFSLLRNSLTASKHMLDHPDLCCILALKNLLGHPYCCLSQERSKTFHLCLTYVGFSTGDLGGERACAGFATLEYSITAQNVLASFKAESLQPQWLKMGWYKHVVFQELLIKKSIWKLLCAFSLVILLCNQNFIRFCAL